MSTKKKPSYIWTSYSDLMTSLFFVMLVLFVLVVAMLHNKLQETEDREKTTKSQLDKIKELNSSIENINKDYFKYDEKYRRHTLKDINISFKSKSSDIEDISVYDQIRLRAAGKAICKFMKEAKDSIPEAEYLLIIEGQSSKDNYERNYELSYERALSLVKFWENEGINFDSLPCELIISGSGTKSKFREENEIDNQRFVIHIIPKPGIFD